MIRPARDADADGFIALIGACWGEYPGVVMDVDAELPEIRALASYLSGRGGAVWAAEQAGQVVGMVATYPSEGGWHLSRMYVAAGERGTGLGEALIRTAEGHARAAGATRMVLWSDVLFTRAHAFYEKHGYVRRGGVRALHDLSNTIEVGYAKPLVGRAVEALDVAAAESAERSLAALLQACAQAGAAVPFLSPLARDTALGYWRGVTKGVGRGETRLFAAWCDGTVAGAVQLALDMPQTGRHRAELRGMIVSPGQSRQGIAALLLAAAETAAHEAGRTLLVTATRMDAQADAMFRDAGWTKAGTIPGYAVDGAGYAHASLIYYRMLAVT